MEDSFGDPHEVIHGQLDEHSSWLLMNGQCHSFAAALHNRTGWRFVGIWPDSVTAELRRSWGERWWETSPHHVMLVTPDGRLADARGIHTLDEVEDDTLAGERGYNKGNVLWAASLIDQIMRERF